MPRSTEKVARALDDNFSLLVAWERLREAEAIARRTRSDGRPELDASVGGSFVDDRFTGADDTVVDAELIASWEIDLWGRIGALADADEIRVSADLEDYRTAALSLSGEVATTWYRLAEARPQHEVLAEQIETNETVLKLLRVRFGAGQIRSADVLRQQALVEAARSADRQPCPHRRAPPSPERAARASAPGGAGRARGAARRVAATSRDRAPGRPGAKTARRQGGAACGYRRPTGRPRPRSRRATLAAGLIAPLIDGGERRAEVDRARAVTRQRLAEYGDVVLISFREVEDALANERLQREKLDNRDARVDLARKTYQQLKIQYLNGVIDYLGVLDALTAEQELVRDRLAARLELLEFRISLYRALAGGFETAREMERGANATEARHDG